MVIKTKHIIVWTVLSFMLPISGPAGAEAGPESGAAVRGAVEIHQKDGALKADRSNVVVYLEDVPGAAEPPAGNPQIRQHGKQYVPEVSPVLAGTTVDFVNDDNIFHNVFSVSPAEPFDLGVYKKDSRKSVRFDNPGVINLYCNIHPNMVGYVVVLKNPFFARTGPDGVFEIAGVPPGTYKIKAWQRFGPEAAATVITAGGPVNGVVLKLTEEKISLSHKNKWGQDYVDPENDAY